MNTKFKLGAVLARVRQTSRGASTAGESLVGKTFNIVGASYPYVDGEEQTDEEPVGVKTNLDVNFGFNTLMQSVDKKGLPIWKQFAESNDVATAKDKEADVEVDLTNKSIVVSGAIMRMRAGQPVCTPQSYSAYESVVQDRDLGELDSDEWNAIYSSDLLEARTPMYTYELTIK